MRKKTKRPAAILIDRMSAFTNNQLTVSDTWQLQPSDNTFVSRLERTIIDSDDPLDAALAQYATDTLPYHPASHSLRTIPFSQESGFSGNVYHHGSEYLLVVKGMPEKVMQYCDLSENERENILVKLHALNAAGAYVVALASVAVPRLITNLQTISKSHKLTFHGFVSIAVQVPPSTRRLVNQIQKKGTVMYVATGQHPIAAYAIAQQLGVAGHQSEVVDTRHLRLPNVHPDARVYARATPRLKEKLFTHLHSRDATAVRVSTFAELQNIASL